MTMIPVQNVATGVMADLIRRQPPSPARTAFAWQLAVGPQLARATTVALAGGVLTVRARDHRWATELERAKETVLARMQHLLGARDIQELSVRNL